MRSKEVVIAVGAVAVAYGVEVTAGGRVAVGVMTGVGCVGWGTVADLGVVKLTSGLVGVLPGTCAGDVDVIWPLQAVITRPNTRAMTTPSHIDAPIQTRRERSLMALTTRHQSQRQD